MAFGDESTGRGVCWLIRVIVCKAEASLRLGLVKRISSFDVDEL